MGRQHAAMAVIPEAEPRETTEMDYLKWLLSMQTDVAETLNGVLLKGARPAPFGVVDSSLGVVRLTSSAGRLVGWSLREFGGVNPAVIRLRDSRDTSGTIVSVITLAANGAQNQWIHPGVSFVDALSAELVTGANLSASVEGAIYFGAAG